METGSGTGRAARVEEAKQPLKLMVRAQSTVERPVVGEKLMTEMRQTQKRWKPVLQNQNTDPWNNS